MKNHKMTLKPNKNQSQKKEPGEIAFDETYHKKFHEMRSSLTDEEINKQVKAEGLEEEYKGYLMYFSYNVNIGMGKNDLSKEKAEEPIIESIKQILLNDQDFLREISIKVNALLPKKAVFVESDAEKARRIQARLISRKIAPVMTNKG